MSGKHDEAGATPPPKPVVEQDATHTEGGAPKDQAHQDAGDGTLTGSVPAGLSLKELRQQAEGDKTDNSGTS